MEHLRTIGAWMNEVMRQQRAHAAASSSLVEAP